MLTYALPQAAKDGFPQFFAKNVGMRRARGRFQVLSLLALLVQKYKY
jgi:hypothetical protein